MSIKDKFIRDLIDELNNVNRRELSNNYREPINVCYIVSVIDQQIEECEEFIDDISEYSYHINGYDEDISGYTNGRINVVIEKPGYNYCYYIDFLDEQRCWDECNWIAPAFNVTKSIGLGSASWVGDEKDYYKYEEQFMANEKNRNEEVEKYQREVERKRIEDQIKDLQKKLKEFK